MTAPDLKDLENVLIHLEGGIEFIGTIIDDLNDRPALHGRLSWLHGVLHRELRAALVWHEAAHKAHHAAKGDGPRAVT